MKRVAAQREHRDRAAARRARRARGRSSRRSGTAAAARARRAGRPRRPAPGPGRGSALATAVPPRTQTIGSPAPRVSRPSTSVDAGSSRRRRPQPGGHPAHAGLLGTGQHGDHVGAVQRVGGEAARRGRCTAATPVALSLAPGTVAPRVTSSDRAPRARPARPRAGARSRRGPSRHRGHRQLGQQGERAVPAPRAAGPASRGCHISPVWAASWWATRTSVAPRVAARGTPADHVGALARREEAPRGLGAPRVVELERAQRERRRHPAGRGRRRSAAPARGRRCAGSETARSAPSCAPASRRRSAHHRADSLSPALAERRSIAASASTCSFSDANPRAPR